MVDSNDDDTSPAAFIPRNIAWDDEGRKVFNFKLSGTFTSTVPLPNPVEFTIKFNVLQSPMSFTIGVSDRIINDTRQYLGGEFGSGNWAIAGSNVYGEEGVWRYDGPSFKQGDSITFNLEDGVLRYRINDIENSYSYTFKEPDKEFYIGVSVTSDCSLEIID